MKTKQILRLCAMIVAIGSMLLLSSCETENTTDDSGSSSDAQITMTTGKIYIGIYIGSRGRNIATINWGDGTIEDYIISGSNGVEIGHRYKAATNHTITISCETISHLSCDGNQLTFLDVSKNTALAGLWCSENILTSLDVSGCTALTTLHCSENILTSLNVSKNTALTTLWCEYNQLTALDVSKNTALIDLSCDGNQLTFLDVSKNTALAYLHCYNNQFTAEALNALFGTLHSNKTTMAGYMKAIYIVNNPGTSTCDRSIAEKKGWWVKYYL